VKQKHEFTPEEMRSFKKLLRALEYFKKLSVAFPESYMEGFLHVALKQGLGTGEYSQRLEMNKDSTSRILGIIGDRPRRTEKSYALVEQCDDPLDSRKTHYFVTAKGAQILKKIHMELET
jgi:DNA-binding MarR family transcriptional regulator